MISCSFDCFFIVFYLFGRESGMGGRGAGYRRSDTGHRARAALCGLPKSLGCGLSFGNGPANARRCPRAIAGGKNSARGQRFLSPNMANGFCSPLKPKVSACWCGSCRLSSLIRGRRARPLVYPSLVGQENGESREPRQLGPPEPRPKRSGNGQSSRHRPGGFQPSCTTPPRTCPALYRVEGTRI